MTPGLLDALAPRSVDEGCSLDEFCRRRGRDPHLGADSLIRETPALGPPPGVPAEPEPPNDVPSLDPTVDLGDLDDGEPPMFDI